jgi:RNA polymerase sigma-70 factor (ECF subfamily)
VFILLNPVMATDVEGLYRSHGPTVLRRCRRLLRNEEKAVDAMHDVFVEVLRRQDTLEVTAPTGLLLTMATRVCLNRLRTDRRHPEDPDDERLAQILDHTDAGPEGRSLARRWLDRWLGPEPASTQVLAVLHFVDGLTLEEVAAEVGLSVSGVRKRLRTLRERLPRDPGGRS